MPSRFLYAAVFTDTNGSLSGGIYAFSIDTSGGLSQVSVSPFSQTSGSVSNAMAITRDAKVLYWSNNGTGDLSGFLIHSDGSLAAPSITNIPVPPSGYTLGLLAHPMADFLYVSDSGTLMVFAIDSVTGALSLKSSMSLDNSLGLGAITPDGRYLYVGGGSQIVGFSTNVATGALTALPAGPASILPVSTVGSAMVIDPAGKFLYVANGYGTPSMYAYSIDSGSGALTAVPGSPFELAAWALSFAIDASGKFLIVYIGDVVRPDPQDCIEVHSINPDTGALTQVLGSPFTGPCGFVATDSSTSYLYIGNPSNNAVGISTLLLDQSSGALTPVSEVTFPSMTGVWPMALTH